MDVSFLLKPEIQEFINNNLTSDIQKLALKKNPFPDFDWKTIINQIHAKQKAQHKLPTWFNTKNVLFPSVLSIEQTSSEPLAKFKSSLISGKKLIDLTGGFGIDCYYFSKHFTKVVHCEFNEELSDIVASNITAFGIQNIKTSKGDSLETLQQLNEYFDWIYIDPARRSDSKQKVFLLKDCTPNVPENLTEYFKFTNRILIKTAPILDISAGIQELEFVKKIYIISLENEVKELLWILEKDFKNQIELEAVNIDKNGNEIRFSSQIEDDLFCDIDEPMQYLYEPFSSVMKTGNFNKIANYYKVSKLHQHSHLYTNNELIDFPGRKFEIENVLPYQKKEMKTFFENQKCNITIRNFPISVEEIRKKWKIKDGGSKFAFFTTNNKNEKIVIVCNKI